MFSRDVFEGDLAGLILCETEADSLDDLMAAKPPDYTLREVTEDPFFTGGNLCRTTGVGLQEKLRKM